MDEFYLITHKGYERCHKCFTKEDDAIDIESSENAFSYQPSDTDRNTYGAMNFLQACPLVSGVKIKE